ncbi:MAG: TorF family putative porin [Brevundimonas sp.]|uniref:TorF family putative porin n=1 Tax=Brevundimonas sp. TaxID=1871086 RepID=UPI0027555D66|nr:TorF family putative porin [Brevundimonas sp.]MDP3401012.1 TorF family putative porin [Brevundimonas sp.]MDZ4109217.1 TorF family putative porin [Brevundimonas sp.]
MRPALIALVALTASVAASPALAQSLSGGGWDYGIGAGTDNRSKQVSKSDTNPFVWGLAEWTSGDGYFYGGSGFETIDSAGSDVEVELGFGIRPQVAGFDLDLNATYKWRLDSNPGTDDSALELTADVSRAIGPATGKLRLQHSPDGTGATEAWTWVEARASWDLTLDTALSAGIGRREQHLSVDYTGWDVGVTWKLTPAVDLDLRYHDTDADPTLFGDQYGSALVANVGFYF